MITHFICTIFTGRGINPFRGDEWFKERIRIFKKYTIPSLQNQTNQNFTHWICFRAEEENNPITKELEKYLKKLNYNFVFTFNGQPFWDDKVPNNTLKERLTKSLETIKELVRGDYVYFTVLDSDDMFHKEVVDEIQKQSFEYRRVLYYKTGFIWHEQSGRLAVWPHPTCPPYYTIMFSKDVFLDTEKHLEYYGSFTTHEDIIKVFDCTQLSDFKYVCLVHPNNISTNWGHSFMGEEIYYENQKREILKNFIKL